MKHSRRVLSNLHVALLFAVIVSGGTSTVGADTSCTGTLTGLISGDVTVPKNASCMIKFATVSGNIQVSQGASLLVAAYDEPSTINGSIEANHCKSLLLEGNVTVGGDLQIHQCTGIAKNGFQGPGIKISGNFECHNNSGPCGAWLGKVDGDVHIHNNSSSSASDVSLVTIGGDLQCKQNTAAPTHKSGPSSPW